MEHIGHGIYSIPQAARLLRRPVARVRRWANGYVFPVVAGKSKSRPILQTDRAEWDTLDFRELIELFFVREYDSAGVSIPEIKRTAEALAREYGPHPFASKRLLRKDKFLMAVESIGIVRPATGQLVAGFVESFLEEIDFEDDFVSLWWPREGRREVAVDPKRRRGQPILDAVGVETFMVFDQFRKEQDFDRVADWFSITPQNVERAVAFEMRFADAA